jgi:hypothetical protein
MGPDADNAITRFVLLANCERNNRRIVAGEKIFSTGFKLVPPPIPLKNLLVADKLQSSYGFLDGMETRPRRVQKVDHISWQGVVVRCGQRGHNGGEDESGCETKIVLGVWKIVLGVKQNIHLVHEILSYDWLPPSTP